MDASRAAEDEPRWLVMRPFRSHLEAALLPGSRVVKANCGHFAWVSPAGEPLVDVAYTACLDCVDLDDPQMDGRKRSVKGSLDLVRKRDGDAGVRQAREWLRRHGIQEEGR